MDVKLVQILTLEKSSILGNNCQLFANVSIYDNTIIGSNVIIHSGTTLGSDGFGFVTIEWIS